MAPRPDTHRLAVKAWTSSPSCLTSELTSAQVYARGTPNSCRIMNVHRARTKHSGWPTKLEKGHPLNCHVNFGSIICLLLEKGKGQGHTNLFSQSSLENRRTWDRWFDSQPTWRILGLKWEEEAWQTTGAYAYHAQGMNSEEGGRLNSGTDCFTAMGLKQQHTVRFS